MSCNQAYITNLPFEQTLDPLGATGTSMCDLDTCSVHHPGAFGAALQIKLFDLLGRPSRVPNSYPEAEAYNSLVSELDGPVPDDFPFDADSFWPPISGNRFVHCPTTERSDLSVVISDDAQYDVAGCTYGGIFPSPAFPLHPGAAIPYGYCYSILFRSPQQVTRILGTNPSLADVVDAAYVFGTQTQYTVSWAVDPLTAHVSVYHDKTGVLPHKLLASATTFPAHYRVGMPKPARNKTAPKSRTAAKKTTVSHRRKSNSPKDRRVSLPAVRSSITRAARPTYKQLANGNVTISHKEVCFSLAPAQQFHADSLLVKPAEFPWLSAQAQLYSRYRFRSAVFSVVSSAATSMSGLLAMAPFYGGFSGNAVNSYLELSNLQGAVSGPIWAGNSLSTRLDTKHAAFNWYNTQAVNSPTEADAGFVVGIEGTPDGAGTATFGFVYISYVVEFAEPRSPQAPSPLTADPSAFSWTELFGTVKHIVDTFAPLLSVILKAPDHDTVNAAYSTDNYGAVKSAAEVLAKSSARVLRLAGVPNPAEYKEAAAKILSASASKSLP